MKIQSVTNENGLITTTIDTGMSANENSDFSSAFNEELNTTASLEKIFQKAADKYGVDVELLKAMAKAESDFDPDATSKSGAMGIMQLMPGTAKSLGVTDAYDPVQNIMGGAKYIADLLDKYDNNVAYALAAYNAGSGNVDKYNGIPPFEETQRYVVRILGYLNNGGVEIPADRNRVSVSSQQSEDKLSDALKQLFTEDDYDAFLRLFLERLTLRLQEKAAFINKETDKNDTNAAAVSHDMKESDAYVAFRNYSNTGKIAVYLRPSEN